jgi:hypothetical protein
LRAGLAQSAMTRARKAGLRRNFTLAGDNATSSRNIGG